MSRDMLQGGATLATATAAKSGQTVTARVNGTVVTMNVGRDVSVASGDVLIVIKVNAQWWVTARAYAAAPTAPTNPTLPDPKPPVVTGSTVINPVETRSYRNGGWYTADDYVYQGNYGYGNNTGCAFYGDGMRQLAGATVLSAGFHVRRVAGGANATQSTTMFLMTQSTRPGGAPTLGASASGPNIPRTTADTFFTAPTSWVQAMVDGSAGGIAFYEADGSPYVRFDGRSAYGPAFSMLVNWQRG